MSIDSNPNKQNDIKESPMAVYGLLHIGILLIVLIIIAIVVGSGVIGR